MSDERVPKVDRRKPTDCDLTLMNARKREKREMLLLAKKPQTQSGWVKLAEDCWAWYKNNEWAMDIDDYAVAHGYTPYVFKKEWPKENEFFKSFIECLYHLLKCRHNKFLQDKGEFTKMIFKERPIYNWELADYERSLKEKGETLSESQKQIHEEIVRKILGKN